MPDKTEIQVKAMEARLSGLERSIDALRKASAPDAASQRLTKQVLDLEKRVAQLEQTMVTKKDAKTQDELDQKQRQQALAKHKAEQDQINLTIKKEVASIERTVKTVQLETRMSLFEARLKGLEALRR